MLNIQRIIIIIDELCNTDAVIKRNWTIVTEVPQDSEMIVKDIFI